jgi:glycopeptide antibiotics resistance protein
MVIAFSLEFTQGWIEGRYSDITDVLGAISGTIFGSWICLKWKVAFNTYDNNSDD